MILAPGIEGSVDADVVFSVEEEGDLGVARAEAGDSIRAFIAPAQKHRKTVPPSLVEVGVVGSDKVTNIKVTKLQEDMLATGDWCLYVGRGEPVL